MTSKVPADSAVGKSQVFRRLADRFTGDDLVSALERARRSELNLYVLRHRVTDAGRERESPLFKRTGLVWQLEQDNPSVTHLCSEHDFDFDFARLEDVAGSRTDMRALAVPTAVIEGTRFVADLATPIAYHDATWPAPTAAKTTSESAKADLRLLAKVPVWARLAWESGSVSLTRDDLWVRVEDVPEVHEHAVGGAMTEAR